jgi:hypothetical protein
VTLHPDHKLQVTLTGQVADLPGSREIHEVIADGVRARRRPGTTAELKTFLNELMNVPGRDDLELDFKLSRGSRSGPAFLVVNTGNDAALAKRLTELGLTVGVVTPRGLPARDARPAPLGDWLANTRSWLIGTNLPALRAYDIRRAAERMKKELGGTEIRAAASEVAGIWLLIAAATGAPVTQVTLDRTPHSYDTAMNNAIHRNLHDAVIPGFVLRWDIADLARAAAPAKIVWRDPTDWMRNVVALPGNFRYGIYEERGEQTLQDLGVEAAPAR